MNWPKLSPGAVIIVAATIACPNLVAFQQQDPKIYTVKKTNGAASEPQQTSIPDQQPHRDGARQTPGTSSGETAAGAPGVAGTGPAARASERQAARGTTSGGSGPATANGGNVDVVRQVLTRRIGSEGFQRLLSDMSGMTVQAGSGKGAPSSDVWFDGAQVRTGDDSAVRPAGTRMFQGSPSGHSSPVVTSVPPPVIKGSSRPPTVQDGKDRLSTYGSIPGGVVLEGTADSLGTVAVMRYDGRFNALVLNDRTVYFVKVPPRILATLCRAIAGDEKGRLGVSLGSVQLVYGSLPDDSDIAWELKMADHFLGEIVFAEKDWTRGYRFANGFVPQEDHDITSDVAIFFTFDGFQFHESDEEARMAGANFSAQLFPLSRGASADGGLMPDFKAIERGQMSAKFQANARHLADNIAYYQRERIVAQMFAYGEVAAVLRKLKSEGFDLTDLAQHISRTRKEGSR